MTTPNLRKQARRFQPAPPPSTDDESTPDAARVVAARLWALHGPPDGYVPRGWHRGDAVQVARVLTACERYVAFQALPVREQRRARLYVRLWAEAAGIVWPVRLSTCSARDRRIATRAARRGPFAAAPVGRGGVA